MSLLTSSLNFQYFIIPTSALAQLTSAQPTHHTAISPWSEDQTLILSAEPEALPESRATYYGPVSLQHLDQARFNAVPPLESQQLRTHAVKIGDQFAELVETIQRRMERPNSTPFQEAMGHWFLTRLVMGNESEAEIAADAVIISRTIYELGQLQEATCFATDLINNWGRTVAYLGEDYDYFARQLAKWLLLYRSQRDEREKEFLAPYEADLVRLDSYLQRVLTRDGFTPSITKRIKDNVLAKLLKRDWRDANAMDEFYDLAGLRVIMPSPDDVTQAEKIIIEQLSNETFTETVTDDAGVETVRTVRYKVRSEPKEYQTGYRAIHIDISRSVDGGEFVPAAEIQIMTRGMHLWSEIQRTLVNKANRDNAPASLRARQLASAIPRKVTKALNKFCHAAALYILECEAGQTPSGRPKFDEALLNMIPDYESRRFFQEQVGEMRKLYKRFAKMLSESHKRR